MLKKIVPVLLFIFVFVVNIRAADDRMRVAVMDLKGMDVSEITAKAVSDLLRTALFNTGYFRVVERSEMDSVLKEQGFQLSGCSDTECAVQIGKLVSAKKIVVGSVSKIGEAYIISARIVDVERGEMEFGDKAKVENESNLDEAVDVFAKKIAAKIQASKTGQEMKNVVPENVSTPSGPGGTTLVRKASYILMGAGAVSAVLGIVYNSKYNNAYNTYSSATYSYTDTTDWHSAWSSVTSAQNNRNLFYGIGIGAGGLGIVLFTIDLLSSHKTTDVSSMNNSQGLHVVYNDGYKISYDYRW